MKFVALEKRYPTVINYMFLKQSCEHSNGTGNVKGRANEIYAKTL